MFAGGVGRSPLQSLEPGNRGDRDNPAPIGLAHAAQAFAHSVKGPVEICRHHLTPERRVGLVQGAALGDAGIGNADLYRAACGDGGGDAFDNLRLVGHVHRQRVQATARHLLQNPGAPPGDRDLRPVGRKRAGNRQTDATAAAGDQRVFTTKCHVASLISGATVATRPKVTTAEKRMPCECSNGSTCRRSGYWRFSSSRGCRPRSTPWDLALATHGPIFSGGSWWAAVCCSS